MSQDKLVCIRALVPVTMLAFIFNATSSCHRNDEVPLSGFDSDLCDNDSSFVMPQQSQI